MCSSQRTSEGLSRDEDEDEDDDGQDGQGHHWSDQRDSEEGNVVI